ncbi:hypothetical protein [Streptomyces sp. NPDC049040]|uniref:hypothetical protein n=1 Tax=Streptomyces sp. NPDC049040 TaxID=3365593 RepID=UPI00371648E1
MSASPLVLPPVRLLPADELAQQALAVPLLDRALRLARWAAPERAVDAMGELLDADLVAAAEELGLAEGDGDGEEDGLGEAAQAWAVAVDTGLVDLEIDEEAEESTPPGEAAGRAVQGEAYERVTAGDPQDVLELWLAAAEAALAEAASPDLEQLRDLVDDGEGPAGEEPEWDPDEEAEFLDTALANLYTLMALDDGTQADQGAVPLPVLAASLVVPDEMEQPSDAVLEEVTEVMMRLDDHFRLLAPAGLLDYQPVDEALIEEHEESGPPEPGEELDPEEISRYGLVRLTPLGVHGLRRLLVDAGASAPVVGDLAGAGGTELLDAMAGYPDHAARAEAESWLADRKPVDAARELLAAGRGEDEGAPSRRLMCQQTLTLVGAEAEPALREVLDDRQLGGLARVWLTESGASDVPTPDADMIFWLTIDTLAAQLAADDDVELLSDLVRDLVARHDGFFDTAWRVEHPATADVLEAMGRLHPDRKAAKDARKAAFKARSRDGS